MTLRVLTTAAVIQVVRREVVLASSVTFPVDGSRMGAEG